MLNEQEKQILIQTIKSDFPEADERAIYHMLHIVDHAFTCSELMTGKQVTKPKAKAIVAQLKSLLQLLSVE
jgi:hypothetical protein